MSLDYEIKWERQINYSADIFGDRSLEIKERRIVNEWIFNDLWSGRKIEQLRFDKEDWRKGCWSRLIFCWESDLILNQMST